MIDYVLIDGESVNLPNTECISKLVTPCDYSPVTYKTGKMIESLYIRTDTSPYKLKITLFVTANNADDLRSRVYRLSHLTHCDIKFLDDDKLYKCTLTTASPKILSGRNAMLDLEFEAEIYSCNETAILLSKNPQPILIDGARDTALNFEVTAISALTNFKINTMTIKSLAPGNTLIINSTDRLVDMSRVDMMEFPQAVGLITVAADVSKAKIILRYRARW